MNANPHELASYFTYSTNNQSSFIMWVRFTEVISHSGKDINLYFIQETGGPTGKSFKVYVKGDENFNFNMFKDRENKWTIAPQNLPHWVFDVQPQLNKVLQKTFD